MITKILKAINEGINTGLLQMNDDDIFDKSHNKSSEQIFNDAIYNFKKCRVGDPVYIDEECGINTQYGELLGYCIQPEEQVFVYKEVYVDFAEQKYFTWKKANVICQKFTKKYKVEFQLPNKAEFEYICMTPSIDTTDEWWCWTRDLRVETPSFNVCANLAMRYPGNDTHSMMYRSISQKFLVLPVFKVEM